jgi:hypothetical protein
MSKMLKMPKNWSKSVKLDEKLVKLEEKLVKIDEKLAKILSAETCSPSMIISGSGNQII